MKAIPPIATHVNVVRSVCLHVVCHILVLLAKVVGRNEVPFGRDTHVTVY